MKRKFVVKPIDVTALIDLVDKKKRINPWQLTYVAEAMYVGIKTVGVENLTVSYEEEGASEPIVMKAIDLSERSRGVADLAIRIIGRFSDYSSGRLEAHFGIRTPLEILLHDIKGFQPTGFGVSMDRTMNIASLVEALLD